ncbi:hypothetical protein ElyMa_006677400 [Elysia marginata]|uniref:MAM domain-containing protein n=1 Tax=Elysia marginata TaxID=1093978 RepID=A0AAV4IMN5_9GAST|nr:hypothetical protein ElyMa_006677400 [Elysia marginata]
MSLLIYQQYLVIFLSPGDQARLVSPSFQRGEVSCLEFSYLISSHEAGTLSVRVGGKQNFSSLGSAQTMPAASRYWHSVILPLNTTGEEDTFQVSYHEAYLDSKF